MLTLPYADDLAKVPYDTLPESLREVGQGIRNLEL